MCIDVNISWLWYFISLKIPQVSIRPIVFIVAFHYVIFLLTHDNKFTDDFRSIDRSERKEKKKKSGC